MPDPLDLTGDIAAAIDGAALRNATLAVAYVRDDGSPSVSFRGSTQVHSATELALWARKRDSGGERNLDPDRGGVAIVIDVDSVAGAGADGFFQQARA